MKTKNLLLLGLITLCSVFGVKAQTVSSSGDYVGNVTLSITGATGVTQIDWYNGGSDVATITPDSVGHVSTSFTPASAGTYKAIITTASGLDTTNAVVVSAMPVPLVAVNGAAPGTGYVGSCYNINSFSFSVSNLSHSFSYTWDFGDSSAVSHSVAPSHSYASVGTYKVTVTVVDGAASSTYDQFVTVYPNPGAAFNVVPGTVNGNAYTFVSNSVVSSGYIATYSWTFGDGTGDTLSNPSKIYSAIGSYHVGLTITTDNGCTASTSSVLNVVLTGSNAFTVNHSTACFNGNSFTFTNTLGNSNGASYRWNFGDSTFSNSYSPSHSYSAPGSYIVVLQVTIDTTVSYFSKTVTVYPKPSVSYSVIAGTGNGHSYTFNNTSSIATGSVSYAWNFGDGTVDSTTSPTHTFAAIGIYHVKLKATSDNGCKDSVTATQNITLTSIAASAAFTANHTAACLNGNSFSFANNLGNANGATYTWAYGDSTFSTGYNGAHNYTAAGTYTVSVTATIDTTVATYSQTVTVYPKPSVSYSVIAGTGNGSSYTFNNTSTIASGSVSYAWNFSDGTVDSTTTPTHTYTAVGSYSVKLKATSDKGCSDSLTKTQNITLTSIAASAAFTANHTAACLNGNSFSFANNLGNANGATYTWAYGDSTFSTGYNGAHNYTAAGTYTVSVTATIDTTVATYSQTVTVYPKPSVSYSVIAGTGNGSSYTFISNVSIGSGSFNNAWSFGDGTVDSTNSATHTFTAVGTYPVKLVVTSDNGCKDSVTVSQNITLTGIASSAAFTANHPAECLNGNSFSFANNLGNSNGATYAWAYGDNTFSAGYNGAHTYTAAGTYTVTLTATIDTTVAHYSQTVTVYPKPSVSYSVVAGTVNGSAYTFNSTSTIASGSMNYAWNFGDGTVDSIANPSKIFTTTGSYPVKLVVTSDNGCKDSVTVSQNIVLSGTAAFTVNTAAECLNGNSFTFYNGLSNGSSITYNWAYGDSTFSTGYNGAHTYTAAGTYNVTLTVTIDTSVAHFSSLVTVYPKPSVSYNVIAGAGNGNAYSFISTSTIASGSANYAWNFGDGTVDSTSNPTHTFAAVGTYPVKLVVTSDNGCKDSLTKSQNITLTGIASSAAYTANHAAECLNGNSFSFANNLGNSNGATYAWAYGDSTFSAGYNGAHAYTAAGTYTVTLTATIDTTVAHYSQTVTVYPKPSVSYSVTAGTGNGNAYTFVSSASIASGSMNYAWTFGDGTVDSTLNPTHTFAAVGTYPVKLVVTSDNGCKDSVTVSQNITLTGIAASAAFTANHAAECLNGNSFSFANNLGNSNGATYAWAYGDSTFSAGYNGAHTYTAAGTYTVTLTATIDTTVAHYSQTVTVYPKPSVAFGVTAGTGNGNGYTFYSTSSISAGSMNYAWTFGDGTVDSTLNPTHTFAAVGTYPVKLVVTSDNGCKDSVTVSQNITLTGIAASAAFTANHAAECLNGNSFSFANNLGNSNGATYAWAYGDSTFSAGYNGAHTYTAAGTYTVTLTATIDTTVAHYSQTVTVYPKPNVSYSVIPGTSNGSAYTFISNATIASGYLNYAWNFGDGNVDSTVNPAHIYAAVGSYPVKLLVTSDNGCKDSITVSQNITLTGVAATAAFTANHAAECLNGNSFSFANNLGNSNGASYAWAYGDSTFSAGYNGSHAYTAAGTYTVTLTVTIDTSIAFYSQTVTVYPKPSVSYSVTPGTGNGNAYTFISTSTIVSGAMNYAWTFGDGTVDSTVNPTHTFAAVGTYPVKLVVTSDNGCKDSVSVNQNITLSGVTNAAAFSISQSAQCFNANSFTYTSLLGNSNGASYFWNYGDDTAYLAHAGSPITHAYAAPGVYKVTLKVVIDTTIAYYTQFDTVYPKPAASYTVIAGTGNGNAYTFISTSTITAGYINNAWTFGDGTVDSTVNPTHTFAAVGTYPVKLVITSDEGCKDSVSVNQNITLSGVTYAAAFSINHSAECFNANSFTYTSLLGNSNGASYFWNYGDDTVYTAHAGSPITHAYAAPGVYTVTLKVVIDTTIAYYTQYDTVYPKPTVSYTVLPGTVNGNYYTFISNATILYGAMNYAWDFGDNTVDSVSNPSKLYAAIGAYPVKLVVTSDHGCKDSAVVTQQITLSSGLATAAFTVVTVDSCLKTNKYSFTNHLTIGSNKFVWSFGDGTYDSTVANYSATAHTYANPGTYTVALLDSFAGAGAKYSQTITVYPSPIASFTTYVGTGNGTGYTYISNSTIASGWIAKYAWDLGNGSTDSVSNPTTGYLNLGIDTVRLVVTSNAGCKDSIKIAQNISITDTAQAPVFSINTAGQCQYLNSFSFTNNISPTSITKYVWNYGDSTLDSTNFNGVHSYIKPGTYTVSLKVTIGTGATAASNTYSKVVTVYPQPVASYYLILNTVGTPLNRDLHICFAPGLDFSWIENSTILSGNMTYSWSYGTPDYFDRNGHATTSTNPRIVFNHAGTDTVRLVVTSDHGCTDTTFHIIYLSEPHAIFTTTVTYPGNDTTINPAINFTGNTSYDPGGTLVDYAWVYENGTHVHNAADSFLGPLHFARGGVYTNQLTVTSDAGCINSVSHGLTFYIKPVGQFTLGNLVYPTKWSAPTDTVATNTSSVDETPQTHTYTWDFGDGSSAVSGTKPYHTYTTGAASRTVTLTVTNTNGGYTNTYSQILNDIYIRPQAAFSYSRTSGSTATLQVGFTNHTTSADLGSPISSLTYAWDFGDGSTSSAQNPGTHTYASGGQYTVQLIVTNPFGGLKDTISHQFTYYVKPIPAFTISTPTYSPDKYAQPSYTFTNTSSVNDLSGNLTYSWKFGDGVGTSTATSPSYTYTKGATNTVTLYVTNTNGNTIDSIKHNLTDSIRPKADFTSASDYQGNKYSDPLVRFTNTTSSLDGAAIYTYAWSFGDAPSPTTSAAVNPTFTYTKSGTYHVTLIATNTNGGMKDTVTHDVVVSIRPQASFTWVNTADSTQAPSFNFTDHTTSNDASPAYSYTWSFVGATTTSSTIASPTGIGYTSGGSYQVRFIVTNSGLSDTVYQNVTHYVTPVAVFTATKSYDVNGYPVITVNSNSSSVDDASASMSYLWTFGDGYTTTTTDLTTLPSHTYSAGYVGTANTTLTLKATNANGNLDSIVSATYSPAYIIPVGISYTDVVSVDTVKYTATATDNSGGTLSYHWIFGDGNSANQADTNYIYANAGTYTATLVVTSSNGGVDTVKNISVTVTNQTPVAVINVQSAEDINMEALAGLTTGLGQYYSIYFDGTQSTISSGSITDYNWSVTYKYSDGTSSPFTLDMLTNPYLSKKALWDNVSTPNTTEIDVTLTVTSDKGVPKDTSIIYIFGTTPDGTADNNAITAATSYFRVNHPTVATVYPNPVVTNTTIKYSSDVAGIININVYSEDGKLVHHQTATSVGNNIPSKTTMNVGNLMKGIYNVIITDKNGNKVSTTKLVKVK